MRRGRGAAPSLPSGPPRRRVQGWLFTLAFIALGVGTVAGVAVARQRADDLSERRAESSARMAASALTTEIDRMVAGLAGSGAVLRDDGTVDVEAFDAFAADLIDAGAAPMLGLVEPPSSEVPGGHRIVGLAPEPPEGGIGVDVGSERARVFERAGRTKAVTTGGPVQLLGTRRTGIELVRPVFDRRATPPVIRAYVVAGVPAGDLAELARSAGAVGDR